MLMLLYHLFYRGITKSNYSYNILSKYIAHHHISKAIVKEKSNIWFSNQMRIIHILSQRYDDYAL